MRTEAPAVRARSAPLGNVCRESFPPSEPTDDVEGLRGRAMRIEERLMAQGERPTAPREVHAFFHVNVVVKDGPGSPGHI